MVGGRVQVMFDAYATSGPHIQNGTFRALAVALPKRSSLLPAVPTLEEAGVRNHDVVSWGALMTTPGTPRAVVQRLNSVVEVVLADPAIQARIRETGGEPAGSTPDALGQRIRSETARWAELGQKLGLRPE